MIPLKARFRRSNRLVGRQKRTRPIRPLLRIEALEPRLVLAADLLGFDGQRFPSCGCPDDYFDIVQTTALWENPINVKFRVVNLGNSNASPSTVAFFISDDSSIGNGADFLWFTLEFP